MYLNLKNLDAVSSNKIIARQHKDPNAAIGLAAAYVAARPPFGTFRADRLMSTIVGQVQRRHYAFAIQEGRVVGYGGWALCTRDVAEAWLAGRQVLASEVCRDGDVVIPVIISTSEPAALRCLTMHVCALYPGRPYMGRRILPSGSRVCRGRIKGIAQGELNTK